MAFWQKAKDQTVEQLSGTLKLGSNGNDVKVLQTLLNQNGANLAVDGKYGLKTELAVRDYQTKNNLTVDGMVGPETSGALTGGSSAGSTGNTGGTGNTETAGPAGDILGNGSAGTEGAGSTEPAGTGSTETAGSSTAPKEFTYDEYTESPVVSQAYAALQAQLAAKPGDYQSTWQGQINGIIDRIMNREDFSYDVNSDALYQQYKDQYASLGKLAMQDTMGQAAALTGGYGSSYASTAGNQAYQSYLSQLNEVVPELYGMARDQYNQEGQDLYNQYGLLANQENQDYGRYVDQYNQWASERDHLQGTYNDERNFDYGKYSDDKGYAYDEYRNAIADQQWEKNYELNENSDNRAQEAWELEKQAYTDSTKSYAGTTPGGASYNNGSLTNGQVKELQAALGVEVDGYYGENSKKAAGDLSAAEAYAKYVGTTASETGEVELKSMTPEERVAVYDTLEGFLTPDKDGSVRTFEAKNFINYLYMHEYIDEDEWKELMDHYLPGLKGEVDTSVTPDKFYSGTGGGGGAMNSVKN